jgi:SnoaL-like domain
MESDAILRVVDRLEIQDLPKRYAHGIDNRDWPQVDACFLPDAKIIGTQYRGIYPEYIANLRGSVERFRTTMHFFGTQLTEVNGDNASMITYGIAFHLGSSEENADFVIGVRYRDEVVRADGRWAIQQRSVDGIWKRNVGEEMNILALR